MKKKIISKIEEIKKILGTEKMVIGTDKVIKNIKKGSISRVFLASNTSPAVKKQLEYYSKLAKIEMILLDKSNEDLGAFCKKSFKISVLGILKE